MHQRTWLSILTFPLVAAFTFPMLVQSPPSARKEPKPGPQDPLAGLSDIQDVLALVREHYVDPPDLEKVISGGIQGALERAHPLNSYLSPEDLLLPDPGPADPGLTLRKSQIYAQVLAVTPGGPAEKAGVHAGDVIRKLDGKSLGPLSAWALERSLRGPEGSRISLQWYDNQSGTTRKITLAREKAVRSPLGIRKESAASVLSLPDLSLGRGEEVRAALASLDPKLPLVLDLRRCAGGDLGEMARIAGMLLGKATLGTIQETGKPETPVDAVGERGPAFAKLAVITGFGTSGPAELLVTAFRKQGMHTFGDRTAAMGVARSRFALRQGGAVELVNRRWIGAGGEKLDRQGFAPEHFWRGLKPDEDLLPRILERLSQPPAAKVESKAALQAKSSLDPRRRDPNPAGREVA